MPSPRPVTTILVGTAPGGAGGVAQILPGWEAMLQAVGAYRATVPTHRTGGGLAYRSAPLVSAPWAVVREVRAARAAGQQPIAMAHAGRWWSILRELQVLSAARAAGAKTVLVLHADNVRHYVGSPARRAAFFRGLSVTDAVAALTPTWTRLLIDAGYTGRVFTWPNPLSAASQALLLQPRPPRTERHQLLSMARLVPGKGFEVAIGALAELPNAHLDIAGTGELDQTLRALVERLDLSSRVSFHGWVSGERKATLLARADVFVLPSTYDSFGLGFVEALAAGTPVVAARHFAIPDVVPGDPALSALVPVPPSASAVAAEVRRLLSVKPNADALRAHVSAAYHPDHLGPRVLADLRSLA